jgi:hypothetical protein
MVCRTTPLLDAIFSMSCSSKGPAQGGTVSSCYCFGQSAVVQAEGVYGDAPHHQKAANTRLSRHALRITCPEYLLHSGGVLCCCCPVHALPSCSLPAGISSHLP